MVVSGTNKQKSEEKAPACSKWSQQCRRTKASEGVGEVQGMPAVHGHDTRLQAIRSERGAEAKRARLNVTQQRWGATESYGQKRDAQGSDWDEIRQHCARRTKLSVCGMQALSWRCGAQLAEGGDREATTQASCSSEQMLRKINKSCSAIASRTLFPLPFCRCC